MSTSTNAKKMFFLFITLLCLVVAVVYTFRSSRKSHQTPQDFVTQKQPSSVASAVSSSVDMKAPVQQKLQQHTTGTTPSSVAPAHNNKQPHLELRFVAINMRDSPDLGKVEYSALDAVNGERTATGLHCERIYFAATKGICLRREVRLLNAQTSAILLDASFQTLSTTHVDGIPSRARISTDGRYAAFTVFVTGHSYSDPQLSTATLLLNADQGTTMANLEEFKVIQDGKEIRSSDFNYWGVTFQHDSDFFYATLRTGGTNYLVHGDIKARIVTVIYKGVECPSLSPDEKRVAYKKLISRNNWRLTVLDLGTFQETSLAETRSVDDQAEWLDNSHVLYSFVNTAPWMDVMVVPADGSGSPNIFAHGSASPAIIRIAK